MSLLSLQFQAENLNKQFSQGDIHRTHRHMKRFSISVAIRKMPIKTLTELVNSSKNGRLKATKIVNK